jgi:hypothetical protein
MTCGIPWQAGLSHKDTLPLIGRALNHSQTSTTERYAHLALDPVREALERNATLMLAAQSGK